MLVRKKEFCWFQDLGKMKFLFYCEFMDIIRNKKFKLDFKIRLFILFY